MMAIFSAHRHAAHAQAGAQSAADGGAALAARLQQIAATYVAERAGPEHITGVALEVDLQGGGTSLFASSGTDGRDPDPQPMNRDTLFQAGSHTKSFTAALILKLEAQGRLSLDQTVGDWLPEYPAWKTVTIRSLLNMTSGIPGYAFTDTFFRKVAADVHHQFTPEELIAIVDPNQGSTVPPTTGYDYSDTNYLLAGLIIEKASGVPYTTALRQWLLRPLRLRGTYYTDGRYPRYVLDREPAAFFWDPSCPRYQPSPCPPSASAPLLGQDMRTANLSYAGTAGAVVSTLGDLARWYHILFGGRVLEPQQFAEMTSLVSMKTGTPITDVSADDPGGFGLGLSKLYSSSLGGSAWIYEFETLGARMLIAYWPQYDLAITASANSAVTPGDATDRLLGPSFLLPIYTALQDADLIPSAGAATSDAAGIAAAGMSGMTAGR
jgi:D-alanyl-D-alanine carboxypeptidase